MKCPKCEGGKMTITMSEYGSKKPPEVSQIKCVHCDGTGDLSKKEVQAIKDEEDMWCKCGNPSEAVDFYNDGEHPEIHKHHYRCKDCFGIVQIG